MSFDLPALPAGWSYAPLETCSQKNSITYGVVQPGAGLDAGKPLIRVNNFKDGRLDLSDVMYIAPEIESKYSRTRLVGGEVLLTVVGSVGQVATVPSDLEGFNVARAVAVVHPLPHIDPRWIAICLRSPLSQHLLGSRANTTVQTTINLKDLRALPVPLPPPDERLAIVELIGALDDRITLLRETNATLEAIAQALFKSWFVDFDPVRAKMEGRTPEGMDEATAALFPDGFETSELGEVPRGWVAARLADTVESIFSGGTPDTRRSEFWGGSIPWFSSGETRSAFVTRTEKTITQSGVKGSSTRAARYGDVLIASAGQGHTRGQTSFCAIDCYINQSVVAVRGGQRTKPAWLFFNLRGRYEEMRNLSDSHSSRGSLTTKLIGGMPILVPPVDLLTAFDDTVGALIDSVVANEMRAENIGTLRDTVLPRLISGQLRLLEAAALAEEGTQ